MKITYGASSLLEELGELSSAKNLAIQTHISENKKEVLWVSQLEPDCDTYAQVTRPFFW